MKANVIQLDNAMPREKWVKRIATAWREQLPSIFETGALLEAAKAELKYGEWGAMFTNSELPFSQNTAGKLIAISQNDNVRDSAHEQNLPVTWTTLFELTKLTAEQFETGIKSGAINPKMQRSDVNALRGIEPKKKEEAVNTPQNLDDWISEFSVRITRASTELSKPEVGELIDCLKQIVAGLEAGNV